MNGTADDPARSREVEEPKIVHIIFIALIAIAFTAGYIVFYELLIHAIWLDNDYTGANRWLIPAGVMFFSLLVGLCRKYLHAPTMIDGGFVESMKGSGEKVDYRTFPGALLSSLLSLLSGASVGPEGAISILISDITSVIQEKFRIARESADASLGFNVAALASAYNGIIGSVLFTGVFATEFQVGGEKGALKFLTWNLLAGSIGYLFFLLLGLPPFAHSILFPPIGELHPVYVLYAIVFGIIGALLTVFTGLSMHAIGGLVDRVFEDRVILPLLAAGAVIALVGYFVPDLLFSGQNQIHTIIDDPVAFGAAMLLFMAVAKILLLALSFRSGFVGGPVFPLLFSCTMIGLAVNLVFPGVPVAICVMCIEAAAFALALGAPLTAILLVVVIGTADPAMTVLLVLSAVTAMILGEGIKRRRGEARSL
ncbi:MAG: chloride channel protein [Methanomicrobiaceae archaeon]|nr:chloride channel protein [Methanomicrobiaceae archaeon]